MMTGKRQTTDVVCPFFILICLLQHRPEQLRQCDRPVFYTAYAQTGVAANLLTDARLAAAIGGIAIAVGVLTFSKRVMMTVGSSIADISPIEGFLVILGMALTVVIMGSWMHIPVSTSQAVVGAVIGAGLTRGIRAVHFGVLKSIALAWISSPTIAGLLTYLVAIATRSCFG